VPPYSEVEANGACLAYAATQYPAASQSVLQSFCTSGWGCSVETSLAEVCYYPNPNTSATCTTTANCNTGGYTGLTCDKSDGTPYFCAPDQRLATNCWAYTAGTRDPAGTYPNIPAGAVTIITNCTQQNGTWH
jgi:hypothetical protein